MPAQWTLNVYANTLLQAIREMDAVNTTAMTSAPNYGTQFSAGVILQSINDAIGDCIMMTGYSPRLTDKIVSQAVTVATDYPLPADCGGLQRVEYQVAPQITGTVTSGAITAGTRTVTLSVTNFSQIDIGDFLQFDTLASGVQELVQVTALPGSNRITGVFLYSHASSCAVQSAPLAPYRLDMYTPDEFDGIAGTGSFPTTVISLGLPYVYREPVANAIRFYPAIGPAQVANGDQIVFTYSSLGTTLVNPTDVANIPIAFQRGVIYRAASDLWMVKADDDQRAYHDQKFHEWVGMMKAYRWNLPQSGVFGFIDLESEANEPLNYIGW